jgi:general secretion pathway protein A
MYHRFYGLRESPFALTPDPVFLYLSDSHREALASMTYGVQERRGFVLILGEVGTGKTTLIRRVLEQFGADIRTVYIYNTDVTFDELLAMVLRDLEIPCESLSRLEMTEVLNDYLLKEAAAGRYVVLIIDEAQHLSPSVLEQIRMLSNLETATGKLLQVILAGQPELAEKLARRELRQLRQRIGLIAELKPLTAEESARYIAHRLEVAGHRGGSIFTARALRRIHHASGGIPRLINVLCDKALVLGYASGARRIDRGLVDDVVKDWDVYDRRTPVAPALPRGRSHGRNRMRQRARPRWLALSLLAVAVVVTCVAVIVSRWDLGFPGSPGAVEPGDARLSRAVGDAPGRATGVAGTRPGVTAGSGEVADREVRDRGQGELVALDVTASGAPGRSAVPAPRDSASTSPDPPAPPIAAAAGPVSPARDAGDPATDDGPTREIEVRPGDTLAGLAFDVYGRVTYTLLDFVKLANPHIANVDEIVAGQRLRFPPFQPSAMVHEIDGPRFRVHLFTISDTELKRFATVRRELAAAGRVVEVTPVHLAGQAETWRRVTVGNFPTREEAERFVRTFRASGRLGSLW